MIYKNLNCRKVRGSHILFISCGSCKTDIVKYQKQGRGNLLRMHIDRIIESSIELSKHLSCPNCGKALGIKVSLKNRGKEVYKMNRSTFNTRESHS